MHEHGLARELMPQLQQIADKSGYSKVSRVDLVVGMLHNVSADFLAHSFEHAFENTSFEGAAVNVDIVEPGQEYQTPARDEAAVATGWELLIVRIEGVKADM